MNRFKRITAAMTAALLTATAALPSSAAPVQTEEISVECNYYAGSSISGMKFSKIEAQAYTGKAIKPNVTVSNGGKKLVPGTDYTLSYKNNKKIGTATVTVKGKGRYTGSKTITFKIVPGTPNLKVTTSGNKISFSWNKIAGATSYQLYCSTDNGSFMPIQATGKTSWSTTKLKPGKKTYRFKIRALYKKNGSTVYSGWSEIKNANGGSAYSLDNPNLKVDTRIKWMAWWELDETSPEAELFKNTYGIPSKGIENYNYNRDGKIFDYMYTDYLSRYDKLATAIQSGDSPDLFPFEICDYPYGVIQGRYKPVDNIINLKSSKWDATRDVMDQFELNGKNYCAIYEISFNSLLYYRRSVIKAAGLDDPRELFEQGNWTWDTFLDMARKFQKTGDNKYVTMGFNTESELLATTGTPLIGINNGKLVNNLKDSNVKRAMDLLKTLQSENLRWPMHEMGWSLNPKLWAQGDILFYANGGTWEFEGDSGLKKFADRFSWGDDDICVVPYPRDPAADRYYQRMKQDAYMWCKGSKNANGVAAWIDCCVTTAKDSSLSQQSAQYLKDRYGWTDYNLDFINEQVSLTGASQITPVFDFKNGIGNDIADYNRNESPVETLTKSVFLNGDKTYAELCSEYYDMINKRINEINRKL